MKGIVIASHGHLADGMLDALKLFSGNIEQVEAIGLFPEQDIDDFYSKLLNAVDRVNKGDGVTIFLDLLFGSPCNVSARLYSEHPEKDNLDIITGMNLPLLMEYCHAREFEVEIDNIINIGKNGILDFKLNYIKKRDNT